MDVGEFDYALPAELIAQHPPPERDASRLLVVDRDGGDVRHRSFRDVPACLRPADVLVLNDTRVLPARIVGRRSTGGAVEALVLSASAEGQWRLLIKPAGRLKPGEDLNFEGGAIRLRLVRRNEDGHWLAAGDLESAAAAIQRVGRAPLPPYIRRPLGGGGRSQVDPYRDEDRRRYQTVFARHDGAIAAPTAGLHFTPALLAEIERRGVTVATLTLHVGLGTFEPIRTSRVEDHRIHAERYAFPPATAERCAAARRAGGRVVAVGTTCARTLETVWQRHGHFQADSGETDLTIHPPFAFHAVDALVTNFHLPRSSLLLLVCAFAGRDLILQAYEEAVRQRYRFYSYGDAMMIL